MKHTGTTARIGTRFTDSLHPQFLVHPAIDSPLLDSRSGGEASVVALSPFRGGWASIGTANLFYEVDWTEDPYAGRRKMVVAIPRLGRPASSATMYRD